MKKGNSIIIIILIIMILGLAGYIAYDKIILEKENTEVEEKETKEEIEENKTLDINDNIVVGLFNKFRVDNACYKQNMTLEQNVERLRLTYDNISEEIIETKTCAEIGKVQNENHNYCGGMSQAMMDTYAQGGEAFEKATLENTTRTISAKAIEAKYKELFGEDAEYKAEAFGIGTTATPVCHTMEYIADKGLYAAFSCEGGGTCGPATQKIVSAEIKDEILTMVTKYNHMDKDETITYEFKKDPTYGYVFKKMTRSGN